MAKIQYPLPNDIDKDRLPAHIAIIMDGNGRWAKKRLLPRIAGHKAGVDAVRKIVRACGEIGIKYLTLYTFSSENWARPESEVSGLMKLLWNTLANEVEQLDKNNVRLMTIGRLYEMPENIQNEFAKAINRLSKNTGLTLVLALNYGSRIEIVDMVRKVSQKVKNGELDIEDIDSTIVSENLYTAGMPDPDLLIRTSGEMRISNYLLWQIAYTEFYITNTYWPDFSPDCLFEAIREFQNRNRRFGGIVSKRGSAYK